MLRDLSFDQQYHRLLKTIVDEGYDSDDRTGVGTRSIFSPEDMHIYVGGDVAPLPSVRRCFPRFACHEMRWHLSGSTDVEYLMDKGIDWWNAHVDPSTVRKRDITLQEMTTRMRRIAAAQVDVSVSERIILAMENLRESYYTACAYSSKPALSEHCSVITDDIVSALDVVGLTDLTGVVYGDQLVDTRIICGGNVPFVYGHQWRSLAVDQIKTLIEGIRNTPYSRRHIVETWNAEYVDLMGLPPCVYSLQFRVEGTGLSLKIIQRSADTILGLPHNIIQYAYLLRLIAAATGYVPQYLHWTGGDVHIYRNQLPIVRAEILQQTPCATDRFKFSDDEPAEWDGDQFVGGVPTFPGYASSVKEIHMPPMAH
jgi:thymidylate synthase